MTRNKQRRWMECCGGVNTMSMFQCCLIPSTFRWTQSDVLSTLVVVVQHRAAKATLSGLPRWTVLPPDLPLEAKGAFRQCLGGNTSPGLFGIKYTSSLVPFGKVNPNCSHRDSAEDGTKHQVVLNSTSEHSPMEPAL